MNAQQLMNQDDKRAEAISQLSELAAKLELSYTIENNVMTVTLPTPSDAPLPVVATIEVPVDEEEK